MEIKFTTTEEDDKALEITKIDFKVMAKNLLRARLNKIATRAKQILVDKVSVLEADAKLKKSAPLRPVRAGFNGKSGET